MKQIKDFPNKSNLVNADLFLLQDSVDNAYKNCTREQLLATLPSDTGYPTAFTHWHDESIVVSGGAINYELSPSSKYGVEFYQEPGTNGNSFKLQRLLSAGDYTLNILGSVNNTRAIIKLSINGIEQFNDLDTYYGSLSRNIVFIRNIKITTNGLQEFIFSVNGKNSLSVNYHFEFTKMWLQNNEQL